MLRKILFGGIRENAVSVDLGLLLLRVSAGLALCVVFDKFLPQNGAWGPPDWFIADVDKMGFPSPTFFAWCAVVSEFFGGILLVVGLLTRPAAFFAMITTFVAAFLFHEEILGDGLLAATFFAISLSLLLTGPGAMSLDFFLAGGEHPLEGHSQTHDMKQVESVA